MMPKGADDGPNSSHAGTVLDVERPEWENNFQELMAPLKPGSFIGKLVLDAGGGFGRHAFFAARYGAESVTGAASMTARQPFASLPLELVFHVDTFLDARGVRHLSSTCRALRALHSSAVWRKLYMARWGAPSVRDRLGGHARRRSPSLTDDDTALLHAANRAHPVASAFNFFWCTIEDFADTHSATC